MQRQPVADVHAWIAERSGEFGTKRPRALLAELHPTYGHPESTERLAVLLAAFPEFVEGRDATEDEVLRCHDGSLLELTPEDTDDNGSKSTH